MSAYELIHGFCKPMINDIKRMPLDVLIAQHTLESKLKLARILRSKSPNFQPVAVGDLIEIFIRSCNKNGKWTSPRTILSIDMHSGTVSLPGSNGKTVKAAFEDIRPAIAND